MKIKLLTLVALYAVGTASAGDLLVEAENFDRKGGWVVDQQFMDLMGSPYLLAHGMGRPVEDAETAIRCPKRVPITSMSVPTTGHRPGMTVPVRAASHCRSVTSGSVPNWVAKETNGCGNRSAR